MTGYILGDGAQGELLPHRLGYRIIGQTKFIVALGGRRSTIAHNNQPN
jgi:hypothetical protein